MEINYNDIPDHLLDYISVTREEFDSFTPSVRLILIEHAQRQEPSQTFLPQQHDMNKLHAIMSSWTYYENYYKRQFSSYNYRDYICGIRSDTPFIITLENIYLIDDYIETMAADHRPSPEWRVYQITVSTPHAHLNASLGNVLSKMIRYTEIYDETMLEVYDISIRYTHTIHRHLIRSVHAGYGEGIPIPLDNNYWLIDLFRSQKNCILNCYLIWTWYTKHIIEELLLQKLPPHFKSIQASLSRRISGSISIDKLQHIQPHPHLLILSQDEIKNITPIDTIQQCIYYYINGHMYLLAHESFFGKALPLIRTKSRQPVVSKIRCKPIPTFTSASDINVMDIESYRECVKKDLYRHCPLMVGHIDSHHGYVVFKGDNCLLQYLQHLSQLLTDTDKNSIVVWAHNGGKYDFHLLLESALHICDSTKETPIDILDVSGRYIQLAIHLENNKTLYFRDSCALIPGSLNKIALEFGVEGKMPDIDIVHVSRDELLNDSLYERYNHQDCRVLRDVLCIYRQKGIDAFGVDPLNHPSASSYAKRIFYSRYYKPDLYPLYTLPRHVHNYIFKSYGGGRCEVFRRGRVQEKLHYYDINSSYPHAGTMPLPYGVPIYHDHLHYTLQIDIYLSRHPGFYCTKILKNGRGKPIHGVMHDGKYIFPRFDEHSPSVTLFSEEIRYGIACGYEYRLIDGYEFRLASWGSPFFSDMYHRKQNAKKICNKALEYIYKITVNSAYGFFGYNKYDRSVTRVYGEHMLKHAQCLEYSGLCSFHMYDKNIMAYETRDVLLNDVNIAVASAITSYGRIHLHKLVDKVEQCGGLVMYIDTDSLITDLRMEMYKTFSTLLGNGIGRLKNELNIHDFITEAVFVSCKLYGYKTQHGYVVSHAKGIKHNDNPEKLYDMMIDMLDTPQTFDVWSMITGRVKKTRGDLNVYDMTIAKELSGKYTKRLVLKNGKTIEHVYTISQK